MINRRFLPIFLVLLCLVFSGHVFAQTKRLVPFSFTLGSDVRTSAGVFKKDGTLIRTLWSGVSFKAGSYTKNWDGLTDEGQTAPTDTYDIRLLSNTVSYTWEGVIGNSSYGVSQGNNLQRGFLRIHGMAISGNTAYYGVGYAEGNPSQAKFLTSNPQARLEFSPKGSTDQATQFVATDGSSVYWAGYDGMGNGNSWFVFGTNTSDDKEKSFSSGQSLKMVMGITYKSCIDVINDANGTITGLAVQKSGNLLFVAHKKMHQIRVFHKTSGALLQSLFFNDAAALAVDPQDNLWVVNGNTLKKYSPTPDGKLSDTNISLSGLDTPMALAIAPDNATLLVADGGNSQQLKAYNPATGQPLWTLGQPGGYRSDPSVGNDKFYFSDVSGSINNTFVAYQPDGSFWVGDSGNYRAQHYGPGRNWLDRIMYLQNNYSTYLDQTNPRRLLAQHLEFALDYSKPLGASNGSWTLVKNWRASLPATYFEALSLNGPYMTNIFRDVLTMPNGRVYAWLRRFSDNKWVLVELPPSGPLRLTKIAFDAQNRFTYHITPDGQLKQSANNYSGTSGTIDWQNRPLLGFDADNDPLWGPPQAYAQAPVRTGGEPVSWYGGDERTGQTTASGVLVSFDPGKVSGAMGGGYHLGGLRAGSQQWLWQTAHATSVAYQGAYPSDGAYDVGNHVEYAGGGVSVLDRHIFWNYHGEFWKNSQVNKWQHVYDNGLLVGVFGQTGVEAVQSSVGGGPVAGMGGNVLGGTVVRGADGVVYLYHGEEAGWSGVHRWRIDGLNSIQEQVIPLQTLSAFALSDNPSGLGGVDLLSGLPRGGVVINGTAGWSRNPANEINNAYNDTWTVKTAIMSYDRFASPDLYVNFAKAGSTYSVTRDLGSNSGLSGWSLKGVITFDGTSPNNGVPGQPDTGGSYFEVLDDNGKVLARVFNQVFFDQINTPVKLYGNNQVIAQGYYFNAASATGTAADPIEISMSNNSITIKYRDYNPVTTSAFESGANLKNPKTVRLYFWENGRNYGRTIDIQQLRFFNTATSSTVTTSTATSGTVTTTATAVLPTIQSGASYFIQAKHSGKFIDVFGQALDNGSAVTQYSYNGGKNQQWTVTDLKTGYYLLKGVQSGKYLNLKGAVSTDGAVVNIWDYNAMTNQQYKLIDVGGGYFNILVNSSQKCLEVKDKSLDNAVVIQQNVCGTGDHQKFSFTKVAGTGGRVGAVDFEEPVINLFPNPASDVVTIEGAKGGVLTIVDELGRVIWTARCEVDSLAHSVSSLPAGSYILQIIKDNQKINKRFVIHRF